MTTLPDAVVEQISRVRDMVVPCYQAVPNGFFAISMMKRDMDNATRALAEGDPVALIQWLEILKGWQV